MHIYVRPALTRHPWRFDPTMNDFKKLSRRFIGYGVMDWRCFAIDAYASIIACLFVLLLRAALECPSMAFFEASPWLYE